MKEMIKKITKVQNTKKLQLKFQNTKEITNKSRKIYGLN